MAKYRAIQTEFWNDPKVLEEMTVEDRYFYLYILTNPAVTQIGIYTISKKTMAFELGYSMESVNALMDRFMNHHKLIRYNPETRELAIKNWGKHNLVQKGKPMLDCIKKELSEVRDTSLIEYVAENIIDDGYKKIYLSFIKNEPSDSEEPEENSSSDEEGTECTTDRTTAGGEKEKEKEKEKKEKINKKEKPPLVKIQSEPKKHFSEFVLLTQSEYDKLVSDYGEVIIKESIERLNDYIASRGFEKKYKSHYHTIKNWLRRDGVKPKGRDEPSNISVNSELEKLRQQLQM